MIRASETALFPLFNPLIYATIPVPSLKTSWLLKGLNIFSFKS